MVTRSPIASCSLRRLSWSAGGSRHIELQVAGGADARRAEIAIARGIGGGLGEAEIEPAQQCRDHAGGVAPAVVRALRHPPVDQDHRDVALRAGQDQVRPQIGFSEQSEVRLPVVEKALHEARHIERDVLMDDFRRQPLAGELGGGHGAGGQQDLELLRHDALDQRNDRSDLADARTMNPNQRAVRPGDARFAAPLGEPRRIFLAALQSIRQQKAGQRRPCRRCQPIGAQREWQPVCRHRPFDDPLGQHYSPDRAVFTVTALASPFQT